MLQPGHNVGEASESAPIALSYAGTPAGRPDDSTFVVERTDAGLVIYEPAGARRQRIFPWIFGPVAVALGGLIAFGLTLGAAERGYFNWVPLVFLPLPVGVVCGGVALMANEVISRSKPLVVTIGGGFAQIQRPVLLGRRVRLPIARVKDVQLRPGSIDIRSLRNLSKVLLRVRGRFDVQVIPDRPVLEALWLGNLIASEMDVPLQRNRWF